MTEVIEGWIARDTEKDNDWDGTDLWLYPHKPIRCVGNFIDSKGCCMSLPTELFPSQRWEDEPRKVKITIEVMDGASLP